MMRTATMNPFQMMMIAFWKGDQQPCPDQGHQNHAPGNFGWYYFGCHYMSSLLDYGPIVDALNVCCLVLVILGTEVYHRESLPESTFETTYPVTAALLYEES